jgi:hypothetical protein
MSRCAVRAACKDSLILPDAHESVPHGAYCDPKQCVRHEGPGECAEVFVTGSDRGRA